MQVPTAAEGKAVGWLAMLGLVDNLVGGCRWVLLELVVCGAGQTGPKTKALIESVAGGVWPRATHSIGPPMAGLPAGALP